MTRRRRYRQPAFTKRQLRTSVGILILAGVIAWSGIILSYEMTSDAAFKKMQADFVADDDRYFAQIAELTAKRLTREDKQRAAAVAALTNILTRDTNSTIPISILKMPCNFNMLHTDPQRVDVLVNKQHCLKPLDFTPTDLTSDSEVTLRQEAYDAYQSMKLAVLAAGASYIATSSYRSVSDQITIYQDWYKSLGSISQANGVAALPGYSEHQLGLAVDLKSGGCALECFRTTAAYNWLQKNAYKYGFIERYPAGKQSITGYTPEPWHWRYVGRDVAGALQQQKGFTLEEYWQLDGGEYSS